jgi:pimeloyl-ACP methyl ester carboxylesterase
MNVHAVARAALVSLALLTASNAIAKAAPIAPAPAPVASFQSGIIHVDRYGSGTQSMVLIPGLGSGPWAWYGTIAHFAPHYTIYALTLAGFDGQPASKATPLFATFENDFWKMLADQKIDKPVVIGHSLGGTLAIALAEQHPERLAAVVAVDGLPYFPLPGAMTPQQRAAQAEKLQATLAALTPAQDLAYQKSYAATIGTNDPALVEPIAKLEASSDPAALGAWMAEDLSADLRPDLRNITIPFFEIMPFQPGGPYTQEQTQAFYASQLTGAPAAKVIPIAPSRHFAMLDRPDEFYAAIAQILQQL